jgi:hypothetical protein
MSTVTAWASAEIVGFVDFVLYHFLEANTKEVIERHTEAEELRINQDLTKKPIFLGIYRQHIENTQT